MANKAYRFNPLEDKFDIQHRIAEEASSAAGDVLSTGQEAGYGLLIVSVPTDGITAVYRVDNETLTTISAHADFSTTKNTGSKYNVYYETDQFKVQNNKAVSAETKNIRVAFIEV